VRSLLRVVIGGGASLALAYLAVMAAVWWWQGALLFHPSPEPIGDPARAGHPEFARRTLRAEGVGPLAFWAAAPKADMPVIVVFHGNGGSAPGAAWFFAPWVQDGWGVVLAEYSGYSANPGGPPSEAVLRRDALAYADWVDATWPGHRLIAWGGSLGTGVAAGLAAARPVAAVVLDSPYTSITDMAESLYWWLPVRLLIANPFDTMALLPRIAAPVAVVHGGRDEVIPIAQGRRVFAALRNPGPGVFLPDAGHTALLTERGHAGIDAVRTFLDGVRSRTAQTAQ
jgi:fermentation-respiration switch protein FrsA (DUF1100 family)